MNPNSFRAEVSLRLQLAADFKHVHNGSFLQINGELDRRIYIKSAGLNSPEKFKAKRHFEIVSAMPTFFIYFFKAESQCIKLLRRVWAHYILH